MYWSTFDATLVGCKYYPSMSTVCPIFASVEVVPRTLHTTHVAATIMSTARDTSRTVTCAADVEEHAASDAMHAFRKTFP